MSNKKYCLVLNYVSAYSGTNVAEGMTESELDKLATKETENDKQLRKFKKRIGHYPEQVLACKLRNLN